MELPFGWSLTTLLINLMILTIEVLVVVVVWRFVQNRTNRETVWLEFLRRALIQGMKYHEIEYIKPLYLDLLSRGKESVILNPDNLRDPLWRFLSSHVKDRKDIRLGVRIVRGLGFAKHSDDLVVREELDLQEPVSLERVEGEEATFGQIAVVLADAIHIRVPGGLRGIPLGDVVRVYFYRPASGGFLLSGKIDRAWDDLVSVHTKFQFVHAEERHFMADLAMKSTLCINMVPLIRVKDLPLSAKGSTIQGGGAADMPSHAIAGDQLPGLHRRVQWQHLDPELGIYPAETVRISDRGALLFLEEAPPIDRNMLKQAFMLTLDFVDGSPLEITGHLLNTGRKRYYLFRFGEILPDAHHRLNEAIRANHPERERLS